MVNHSTSAHNMTGGGIVPKTYPVLIHRCEDVGGYWAECPSLPGCFSDGETLQELEVNMFEAVSLYLAGSGDTSEYSLVFEVCNA